MLQNLYAALGIAGASDDRAAQAEYYLNLVEQKVKNYCNIENIPEALELIVVDIARQAYEDGGRAATTIREGDSSVTFRSGGSADILSDYREQLNVFRRLRTL